MASRSRPLTPQQLASIREAVRRSEHEIALHARGQGATFQEKTMPTDPEALLPTAVLDAALIAKVDSLRALLREVEWSGYGSFGSSRRIKGACPTCLGIEPETYDGHLQGLRSWEKPPKSAMRGHAPDYRLDAELR